MGLVVDQEVGDPEGLAPDVEALVGGGDQLQHVRLGDHDLAHGIAEAEGHRLVLGHLKGLGGRGDRRHVLGDGRDRCGQAGAERQGREQGGEGFHL